MRANFAVLTINLAVLLWTADGFAQRHVHQPKPTVPLGNNPHPVIWGGMGTSRTTARAAPTAADHPHQAPHNANFHGTGHGPRRCVAHYVGYRPCGNIYYGYDAYYGPPYFYTFPQVYYYGYLPPLWTSAEDLYGPLAVQRMMGMGIGPVNLPVGAAGPAVIPHDPRDQQADRQKPQRATNAETIARAWRFIGFGDALFARQDYFEANLRYRKAAQIAPTLADALFRQALALSATGRFDLATAAVKRGLRLNPNWPKSDFRLNELYGDNELTRDAQIEALVAAATATPNNADVLFMVGVHLHFDGQEERAAEYFRQALLHAGADSNHIRAFLAD